jgi:hypothetical protein
MNRRWWQHLLLKVDSNISCYSIKTRVLAGASICSVFALFG